MTGPRQALKRRAALLLMLTAAWTAGCDASNTYRAVMRDQVKALAELGDILGTVNDSKSMVAAKAQIEAHFQDFENIRSRAVKLTPPTPDVSRQLVGERDKLNEATSKVQDQVRRIRLLPGGQDFFDNLGTKPNFLTVPAP